VAHVVDASTRAAAKEAIEEPQHAEAARPLDDRVVGVVRGDVAHHRRGGTDPMQVRRARLLGVGIALQRDADLAPQHRFLRGGARALARDLERTIGDSTMLGTGTMITARTGSLTLAVARASAGRWRACAARTAPSAEIRGIRGDVVHVVLHPSQVSAEHGSNAGGRRHFAAARSSLRQRPRTR
jgi:hypothetical protein